jgi:RNA recognition motif-containing protein
MIVGTKIFVGGIDFSLDENFLRKEFSKFGIVKNLKLCKHHETQKSKGYAFITFTTPDEAKKAIEEMDGQLLGSRKIGVSEAIEKRN